MPRQKDNIAEAYGRNGRLKKHAESNALDGPDDGERWDELVCYPGWKGKLRKKTDTVVAGDMDGPLG